MDFPILQNMSETQQIEHFKKDGLFHLLMARQLNRSSCEALAEKADRIREIGATEKGLAELKTKLSHKRGMLLFNQPSSRTFFSFMNALFLLGMDVSHSRDPKVTSLKKGESFEDTVRTVASYTDLLIIRNRDDTAALRAACAVDSFPHRIPVVNAGSGTSEHPTQALLDIYTLLREFSDKGGIDGKRILMAGDLKRGRTVRSLSYLLADFEDVKLYFAAVPEFQMRKDIREFLDRRGTEYEDVEDMNTALPKIDAVYMTRVQDEHDTSGESEKADFSGFYFKTEYLDILKQNAVIMHPLPRRQEIPEEVDKDPRAAYWRQVENGMWARAALIAEIFNVDLS